MMEKQIIDAFDLKKTNIRGHIIFLCIRGHNDKRKYFLIKIFGIAHPTELKYFKKILQ